jgi:N-acetyl-anhydromuramyl-L-alanine amidase AmpD
LLEKLKREDSILVRKIIVHCSDSDLEHHDNIETIRKWHVEENGWSDIGYHFIILKDGTVKEGRPINKIGAHTKGQNHDSIGICLTGKKDFSIEQKKSATMLLRALCAKYGLANDQIFGHKHFDTSKTCPNFEINQILPF